MIMFSYVYMLSNRHFMLILMLIPTALTRSLEDEVKAQKAPIVISFLKHSIENGESGE